MVEGLGPRNWDLGHKFLGLRVGVYTFGVGVEVLFSRVWGIHRTSTLGADFRM